LEIRDEINKKKKTLQRENCKQIVLHIIDNTWVALIIFFFKKKTDMKFIILVSSVFSWKKTIYKKLRCNSTVKIWFGRKKILNYAYMLKNGGRYNMFFYFYTKLAESSFLCSFRIESINVFVLPRFDLCHVLSSSTNNFAHAFPNEFTVRSYENCAVNK
jgi:hypothetical protein